MFNGSPSVHIWEILNEFGESSVVQLNTIQLRGEDLHQVVIDESTVSNFNSLVFILIPQLWNMPHDAENDISLNEIYRTFMVESSDVHEVFFDAALPLNRTPYSHCLVGPYL